jgi:hypothetical protein
VRRALTTWGIAAALRALVALAGTAAADVPPITVSGVAALAQLPGPGTVTFTYTLTVSGSPATAVVITTAQDPLLPADIASIRFDGVTVPADTVTAAAPNFTLRAGGGASAGTGGTLSVGAHTLTFTGHSSSTAPAQASSTLAVTSDQGTVTSSPVLVALNQPDLALSLPADSGEDLPAALGTGDSIAFDAELRNLGAPSAGTLTITLPAGLALGSDGVYLYADESAYEEGAGTPLPCTGGVGTVTCSLDTVSTTGQGEPPILEVDLTATSAGKPGTSATFTVSVAPTTGTDLDPSNNSVRATIEFTGVADLSFAITPDKETVQIGHKATLTLHVTNHGPQKAPMTIGISLLDGIDRFVVTDFDGATTPPGLTGLSRTAAIRTARQNLAAASPRGVHVDRLAAAAATGTATPSPYGVLWFVGDLAPGATATAHLTVLAKAKGTAHLLLFAGSGAADPGCVSDEDLCQPAEATLTAVKASASGSGTDDNGQAPIANTGSPDAGLSVLGLCLVLAGAATTVAGRRRA